MKRKNICYSCIQNSVDGVYALTNFVYAWKEYQDPGPFVLLDDVCHKGSNKLRNKMGVDASAIPLGKAKANLTVYGLGACDCVDSGQRSLIQVVSVDLAQLF